MLGQALGFSPTTANYTGGLLLSMAVLMSGGLAFSAIISKGGGDRSGNFFFTAIVLFVTMGFLYVITWLDFGFLVIAVVHVAVPFAAAAKKGMTG